MTTLTQTVSGTLHKPWLFNQNHKQKAIAQDQYLQQAAVIIAKCKKLLTIVENNDVQLTLHSIIDKSNYILAMTARVGKKLSDEQLDELLGSCQELQRDALNLPSSFPEENNFATVNYKIAVSCVYILVISLCFTAGFVFNAWYYNVLSSDFFVRTLIGALSILGIPGVCLGLFSFGLYNANADSQEEYHTIADDVSAFCDGIVKDYELTPEEPLACK